LGNGRRSPPHRKNKWKKSKKKGGLHVPNPPAVANISQGGGGQRASQSKKLPLLPRRHYSKGRKGAGCWPVKKREREKTTYNYHGRSMREKKKGNPKKRREVILGLKVWEHPSGKLEEGRQK